MPLLCDGAGCVGRPGGSLHPRGDVARLGPHCAIPNSITDVLTSARQCGLQMQHAHIRFGWGEGGLESAICTTGLALLRGLNPVHVNLQGGGVVACLAIGGVGRH